MTEPRPLESESPPLDPVVAARRREILKGLGKGGVALAALSPLTSQAARSHKIANATLAGGFGYASVSGFQSAAVSSTPAAVASTYAAAHFLTTEPLNYASLVPGAVTGNKLATALNAKYFGGTGYITGSQATLLIGGTKLVVLSQNLVILPGPIASSSGTALRLKNSPSQTDGTKAFNAVFSNSSSTLTWVEALYGATLAAPPSGQGYILAAYLSVLNSLSSGTLPTDFNTGYITSTYTNDAALLKDTNAYNFYRALAVTS